MSDTVGRITNLSLEGGPFFRYLTRNVRRKHEDEIKNAVEAERAQCIKEACRWCAEGEPVEREMFEAGPIHFHRNGGLCGAGRIRERVFQERLKGG